MGIFGALSFAGLEYQVVSCHHNHNPHIQGALYQEKTAMRRLLHGRINY